MLKKELQFLLFVFSLMFNIHVGNAHDVEHFYHDEHHESESECEDCLLKHHLVKSNNVEESNTLYFSSENIFYDNYYFKNTFSVKFVAYQSRAP